MSNRLFQTIIHQFKDVVGDRTIGVLDDNDVIIACSELGRIGETRVGIRETAGVENGPFSSGGFTYRYIEGGINPEYILFIEGEDRGADRILAILSVSFAHIKHLYDEKYDKCAFIKNVILDNIMPSDIYIKSKEMHFSTDVSWVAMLIRFFGKTDTLPYDIIQSLFPDKQRDFVISVSERDVVLVKEVDSNAEIEEIEAIAQNIADTCLSEFYVKVNIGIGTVVDHVKNLASSYKESQVALEVGKVFDIEKTILSYENLGIGRLIYQLPTTLCEMFLKEVFKRGTIENLDRETLMTIHAFFENNLNVSETSRKLFVHRNTLVYRLDKIKKMTGLDLREFEHAITFKVALMVHKYLTQKPIKY